MEYSTAQCARLLNKKCGHTFRSTFSDIFAMKKTEISILIIIKFLSKLERCTWNEIPKFHFFSMLLKLDVEFPVSLPAFYEMWCTFQHPNKQLTNYYFVKNAYFRSFFYNISARVAFLGVIDQLFFVQTC